MMKVYGKDRFGLLIDADYIRLFDSHNGYGAATGFTGEEVSTITSPQLVAEASTGNVACIYVPSCYNGANYKREVQGKDKLGRKVWLIAFWLTPDKQIALSQPPDFFRYESGR